MRRVLLLAAALLPTAGPSVAEEEPAKPPPDIRRGLGQMAERCGWTLNFEEDETLLVAGTCAPEVTRECFSLCTEVRDGFCKLFGVAPAELCGKDGKLFMVMLATKPEYMALCDEFERQGQPRLQEAFEKLPANGHFICMDPVYKAAEGGRPQLVHLFGHRLMDRYAPRRGKTACPGWLVEGIAAHFNAVVMGKPTAACVAFTGYEKDQMLMRSLQGSWDAVVYALLKERRDGKPKEGEKRPYTGLIQMMAKTFDALSGQEVRVAWHVVRKLAGKEPERFKAFVDAVLGGQKQGEAFQAAFGRSVDEFERAWSREVLAKPPPEPPKGKPK